VILDGDVLRANYFFSQVMGKKNAPAFHGGVVGDNHEGFRPQTRANPVMVPAEGAPPPRFVHFVGGVDAQAQKIACSRSISLPNSFAGRQPAPFLCCDSMAFGAAANLAEFALLRFDLRHQINHSAGILLELRETWLLTFVFRVGSSHSQSSAGN